MFIYYNFSGLFLDLKIIWFIFGIYSQKKLYRNYKGILVNLILITIHYNKDLGLIAFAYFYGLT